MISKHSLASSRPSHDQAYLPLSKSQLHLSASFGGESLIVLQASAHDAAGDGEVAVVAAARDLFVSARAPL